MKQPRVARSIPHCSARTRNSHFLAYIPSWWKNRPVQSDEGGGCTPTPFTIFTITYKVVVYAPVKRADTPPVSTLLLYVLCGYTLQVHQPSLWTYHFVEVSGPNLESPQTRGFCMDFLNHREGGMVFFQVFLLSPLQCTVINWRNCERLLEFEEMENSSQRCRDDCE